LNYTSAHFRVLRTLYDKFRRMAMEDGVSPHAVVEAVVSGYVNRHPAVLAMIDQYIRENYSDREVKGPKLSKRELAELYAEIGSGIIEDKE
jgi:hypothetical protein